MEIIHSNPGGGKPPEYTEGRTKMARLIEEFEYAYPNWKLVVVFVYKGTEVRTEHEYVTADEAEEACRFICKKYGDEVIYAACEKI